MPQPRRLLVVLLLCLGGTLHCGEPPSRQDEPADAASMDADAGSSDDAGEADAGEPRPDAGEQPSDAGDEGVDAGDETPDAGQESWAPVTPSTAMEAPRSGHASVTLAGDRVMVIDGLPLDSPDAVVEVFDVATKSWSVPEMVDTPSVLGDVAYLLESGEVVTGFTSFSSNLSFYSPSTGAWREGAYPSLSTTSPFSTVLPGGRAVTGGGYTTGGISSGSTRSYDPVADAWVSGTLREARRGALAAPVSDRFAIVVGGRSGLSDLFSAELIDAVTGESRFTGSPLRWYPDARFVALDGGDVLMAGGEDRDDGAVSHVERWSFATGKWSPAQAMATPRIEHTLTRLPDGRVLAIGGRTEDHEALSSIELYDPATGEWRKLGELAIARYRHAASVLSDGRVVVTGGSDADFEPLASVEIIDPSNSCAVTGRCPCEPESDAALCERYESTCATGPLRDRCGATRAVSCATDSCWEGSEQCESAADGSSRCVRTQPSGSRFRVEEASSGNYFQQPVAIGADARGWPTIVSTGRPVGGSVSSAAVALNARRPSGRWVREGLAGGNPRVSTFFSPGKAPRLLLTSSSSALIGHLAWETRAWLHRTTSGVDPREFTGQALVIDAAGQAAMASVKKGYTIPEPYLVEFTTFAEEIGTRKVEALSGGSTIDAALDASFEPHLVYVHPDSGVKHAYPEAGDWVKEVVDAAGGRLPRIFVDASDAVHLVYLGAENHQVKHATRSGSGWTVEEWPLPSTEIRQPLFAATPDGRLHATWASVPADTVHYAVRGESGWNVETVHHIEGATTLAPAAFSMAPDGRPLIALQFSSSTFFATTR